MKPAAERPLSFRDYIGTRRYQPGRVSKGGWDFVARAQGDPHLPDARDWSELRAYLERCGEDESTITAARTVWNSYLALLTKMRRAVDSCSPLALAS